MKEDESSPPLPRPSRENSRNSSSKCSIPCRYSLALLSCFGLCAAYALRVNLSVALVAMVNSTENSISAGFLNPGCQEEGLCNTTRLARRTPKHTQFNWNEETQGIILGSFFYGYAVTQIPGGWLASKYGAKHTLGFAVLISSILTLLTPLIAKIGVSALITLRVMEGLMQGVIFPAVLEIWSSWAPPLERSRLSTITIAGCGVGTIITQPIAGWLCDTDFLGGWPSVFYVFGLLGILWYISWFFLVYDKPANHPRISVEEKEYILSSIGSSQDKVLKNHSVPWLAILTSPAVYAIALGYFSANWGFYIFLTCLPTYLKEVLHFKVLEDGVISSLPYLSGFIFQLGAASLGDWLLSAGSRIIDVRRTFSIVALIVPACLLFSVSYVGSDGKVLIVVLLSVTLGFSSFSAAGFTINPLDIAPRYAGIITGLANCFATIPGFVAPLVAGWLTNGEPTRRQWQKVFYISAVIYLLGALGFVILCKGEEQPWNTSSDENLLPVETEQEQETTGLVADESRNGFLPPTSPSINTV